MATTIANHELAFDIEMIEDALYGPDSHQTRGTLDCDDAVRMSAKLEALKALAEGPLGSYRPTDPEPQEGHRKAPGSRGGNQYGSYVVRFASEPQQRFIARLLAERNHDMGQLDPATVNLRHASDIIEKLLACPVREGVADHSGPSEKQVASIVRESARRVGDGPITEEEAKALTRKEASALLDKLFNAPFVPRTAPVVAAGQEITVGVYRNVEGTIFRVYPARADRTRLLAKKLVLTLDAGGQATETSCWEYAGMAYRFVKAAEKMTLEQAKAFGHDFGICCSCGALLTDPTSIEAGIGPICATKGW